MSQFANAPQSFFYNINRTMVNTAFPTENFGVITPDPPNPYYTGGYDAIAIINGRLAYIPQTVSLAPDAVQMSGGETYYNLNAQNQIAPPSFASFRSLSGAPSGKGRISIRK
jgi:hypothetical protein